jgi:hypothetical protein
VTTDHIAQPDVDQSEDVHTAPADHTTSSPARTHRRVQFRSEPSGSARSVQDTTSHNLRFSDCSSVRAK